MSRALLVAARAAVLHRWPLRREQTFQQSPDPLPAVTDGAFGGPHQLGDAGVGVPVGGQSNDPLFLLDRIPVAGHQAPREPCCLPRLKEHAFQYIVGQPIQALGRLVVCWDSQLFMGRVAVLVQGVIQGKRVPGAAAQDLLHVALPGLLTSRHEGIGR